eukprot:CAMPEP_0119322746 /NCGR_PEP_ID=MMETSP1333-20130426/59059_1 /TAXON_ID=418940 /ORGANISM="Scyphosphaera apsteinii, Strain RCC1455" /LENGTH=281 /DNA_ID=CAMNT_0007330047 /DNA_START=543 /DNA_END=1388 /DNA_ORIENTATION=+
MVQNRSTGLWHLYMAEINCNGGHSPCELHGWSYASQVGHATSLDPLGPFTRKGVALPIQHHNPTVSHAPNGTLLLYSISAGATHTSVATASSYNGPWTVLDDAMAPYTNPSPLVHANGTLSLFFQGGPQAVVPCSSESIGMARCTSMRGPCEQRANPIYNHTGEDPSVFVDARGNFHLLSNGYPGPCKPKAWQGGHAWSRDGVTWSEPRVGAFSTTVSFMDGTSMTCARRERPQMVMDPQNGRPAYLVTGVTGCPSNLTATSTTGTFTLIQGLDGKNQEFS